MGFFSRIIGFDRSRGAFNAVLASYIFEAISIDERKRVADEVLQIVGSVWKHYDQPEIARKLSNEVRVVQCNFLALAFDNLGVEAPGRNAWWRVNNPFVLTSQITDITLKHAAEVVSRDDGFAVSWPGNAARIDFLAVCGMAPKRSPSASSLRVEMPPKAATKQRATGPRPAGKCPNCAAYVLMEATSCGFCGQLFSEVNKPMPIS